MRDELSDLVKGAQPAPARVARWWWLVSGAVAILLVALLGAVIFYREADKPFGFELQWMDELVESRTPFWTAPALVLDALGGGVVSTFVVPAVIVCALLVWRRPWAAGYYLAASVASAVLTTAIKHLVGRPRPDEILVTPDFGSFPSGHSANAAVMAVALGIVFLRTGVWIAGAVYTVTMMLSRTYLGAHWISDTVGGLLVGAGVAVIVWAPFALRLAREARRPHRPIWVRPAPH
ncbi:phosphatase PAP2 family protein [Microbacterium dauci]|uniref:Phosphatase PAP2 family protein n=1 Tax=Microbacterium dauci TaxID=3048008 RepID=A0ABT6ZEY7_9MICO|nr:phosphatase PAP2 family protein [Microbacterium sp. LX3-4]MDJ1114724.1 phosphatase PAP2 family protein [Microbacterium sp. LX3-4]